MLAEGCSGSYIVARALLGCMVSSLEYSGSIWHGRGGEKKGRAQERLRQSFVARDNDRKPVLPCAYLRDDNFGKRPDQKQRHHHQADPLVPDCGLWYSRDERLSLLVRHDLETCELFWRGGVFTAYRKPVRVNRDIMARFQK